MGKDKSIPMGNLPAGNQAEESRPMDKYEHRRRRLVELRDWQCEGKIARLAEKIARSDSYVARMLYEEGKPGKKRIGDDMLEIIELAFSLPRGWFDLPLGTKPGEAGAQRSLLEEPTPGGASLHSIGSKRPTINWPFPTVTYQRLLDLKKMLGPKTGTDAIRDIDALLDIAVTKWERAGESPARKRK